MLLGRLGLDQARIPHADRHGVFYLDRGRHEVEDGCLGARSQALTQLLTRVL